MLKHFCKNKTIIYKILLLFKLIFWPTTFGDPQRQMFFKVIALKKFEKESTCIGLFFNKVADPQNCKFNKKRLQHRFFSVKLVNYSKTPIL